MFVIMFVIIIMYVITNLPIRKYLFMFTIIFPVSGAKI